MGLSPGTQAIELHMDFVRGSRTGGTVMAVPAGLDPFYR